MNREVHVRFWERPEVKVLRATRQQQAFPFAHGKSVAPSVADLKNGASRMHSC